MKRHRIFLCFNGKF